MISRTVYTSAAVNTNSHCFDCFPDPNFERIVAYGSGSAVIVCFISSPHLRAITYLIANHFPLLSSVIASTTRRGFQSFVISHRTTPQRPTMKLFLTLLASRSQTTGPRSSSATLLGNCSSSHLSQDSHKNRFARAGNIQLFLPSQGLKRQSNRCQR